MADPARLGLLPALLATMVCSTAVADSVRITTCAAPASVTSHIPSEGQIIGTASSSITIRR